MTETVPQAPTFVVRFVRLCPECRGLVRRDLDDQWSPWRCDLHGEVRPVLEELEVPTGDEA